MEEKPSQDLGYVKLQLDEAQLKQKIYEETMKDLSSEECFVNYLSGFEESSVKQFKEYYSHMKANWYAEGPMMTNYRNSQQTQWWKYAFQCLEHIQHKKFFNLECEWRAEKIKLVGFEICFDFTPARTNVLDCKVLPAVTREEVDIYIQYLEEVSDEERFLKQWNIGDDYGRLKNNFFGTERPDGVYPEWYRFYDRHFGTEILLNLPDIRGEKEKFYMDFSYKEKEAERAVNTAAVDKRPLMKSFLDREFALWFLKTFDTKETLEFYRVMRLNDDIKEQTEHIEMDLINLQDAKESVPMENDDDWRNGIKRATEVYHRKKTIELLPRVWELYSQRISEGKPAMEKEDKRFGTESSTLDELRPLYLEHILRGRELNGKPRDLNF